MCTETSRDVSEGMSNLWGAYAGNIVTNHKTAFFVSTNHRARKVPRDTERGRGGDNLYMRKAPLLCRTALKIGVTENKCIFIKNVPTHLSFIFISFCELLIPKVSVALQTRLP